LQRPLVLFSRRGDGRDRLAARARSDFQLGQDRSSCNVLRPAKVGSLCSIALQYVELTMEPPLDKQKRSLDYSLKIDLGLQSYKRKCFSFLVDYLKVTPGSKAPQPRFTSVQAGRLLYSTDELVVTLYIWDTGVHNKVFCQLQLASHGQPFDHQLEPDEMKRNSELNL